MTIINPIASQNVQVVPTTALVETAEERQIDLRPEQMVRATVVEGGLERTLLEMNHRHYRAQSEVELQTGQKLTLQVLQTHPTLELRVINNPLVERLGQLLPLLSQSYDWADLVKQLSAQPQSQAVPNSTQVLQQLSQLLQPSSAGLPELRDNLLQLPAQLQQLAQAVAAAEDGGGTLRLDPQGQPLPQTPTVNPAVNSDNGQLLRALQGQLNQLQQAAGRPIADGWVAETRSLLAPLQQPDGVQALPPQQSNELLTVVGQLRQQPSLPRQISPELERLASQLKVVAEVPQPGQSRVSQPSAASGGSPAPTEASAPPAAQAPGTSQPAPAAERTVPEATPAIAKEQQASTVLRAGVYQPTAAAGKMAQAAAPAPVVPAEISAALETLLAQVQSAQEQTGKLPPELLGRLEGLLDKLQQLPQLTQATQPVLPHLETISGQLTQLAGQGPQQPEGGQLGFLSQLFGFHLEAELLQGKKKEALANLKANLLALQEEFGDDVKEPLRRIELFQLCKARLSQDQVQFLPLPFNELEEGYLLMEEAPQEEGRENAEAASLHLTLSLRVSALGNMRIDMLYDKQGLLLRMACEDKEKMEYLQGHIDELTGVIEAVPLRGVSFAADAQLPSRQLLEKLLPEALGMLDARI